LRGAARVRADLAGCTHLKATRHDLGRVGHELGAGLELGLQWDIAGRR
jgi:hypothetical protein